MIWDVQVFSGNLVITVLLKDRS
uniref:Uncharacterized protein n=1 Tax=Arundo donax TaxID=35708 RepID=A0A0A9G0J5_ARUDO